jgi:hypothetical protein
MIGGDSISQRTASSLIDALPAAAVFQSETDGVQNNGPAAMWMGER